ncbi:MAG: hypothetical protein K2K44_03110 [Oscillospiraceae bacterium]|nr:hypothetical protein [Oscillospiraceae bacterium]
MKKHFLAICILSAVMLSSCSNGDTAAGENISVISNSGIESTDGETEEVSAEQETTASVKETEAETFAAESETESTELETENESETKKVVGETDTEIVNRIKSIDVSAYDGYPFLRKYTDKVEDIYIAGEIVGQETLQEWVDNVYLKKSDEEMDALPALYQAIVAFGISEEDFRKKNEEYIDYPGMYFSEEIISALYSEDVNEMKRLLTHPWALYYDGEIYAFDEMYKDPNIIAGVPADVMNEYLDFIETIDEVKVRNIN